MDGGRFDDLSKAVARRQSRRSLVSRVVATAALAAVAVAPIDTTARRRRRAGVSAQGPCGNGSGKANRCKRNRDCCTGYCNTQNGRCRCRRRGQSCTQDRNCCSRRGQRLSCVAGECRPPADEEPVVDCTEPSNQGAVCATYESGNVSATARCCVPEQCPPDLFPCVLNGADCGEVDSCEINCCSDHWECDGVCTCQPRPLGEPIGECTTDYACIEGTECWCGTCCGPQGYRITAADSPCNLCCSSSCAEDSNQPGTWICG